MKVNDVAITYVRFFDQEGGKKRPVLIVWDNGQEVRFYRLTSQFQSKSKKIQNNYFEIKQWREVGLNKPTWIDTTKTVTTLKTIANFKVIGKLTVADSYRLSSFLRRH